MNANMNMDVDPLSTYDTYPTYDSYGNMPINMANAPYPYPCIPVPVIQMDHKNNDDNNLENLPNTSHNYVNPVNHDHLPPNYPDMEMKPNDTQDFDTSYQNPEEEEDIKPDIEELMRATQRKPRRLKKNGKRSNYLSEKIADKNYPFYGCAICNISYPVLADLDLHIATHKDRITSYDLKIKNKIRRKRMKKEKRRLKNLSKKIIKHEVDLEIKPEDGYIGCERTVDFQNNGDVKEQFLFPNCSLNSENAQNNQNNAISEAGTSKNKNMKTNKCDTGKNENVTDQNTTKNDMNKNDSDHCKTVGTNQNKNASTDDQVGASEKKDISSDNKLVATTNVAINKNETKSYAEAKEITTNDVKNAVNTILNSDMAKMSYQSNNFQNAQSLVNLEKIFKCFACNKQFSLSYYLKLHVRSHTDEKPYECKVCGQTFITASKLGRHNKRIHLAIRYQCRICFKYFTRFEYLTRHFDKKHAEDKLEGEPYDYNAILPYLKELEEQLREKAEKENKPKIEDPWEGWPDMGTQPMDQSNFGANQKPLGTDQNQSVDQKDFLDEDNKDFDLDQTHMAMGNLDIIIEEVKVNSADVKNEVEVKIEKVDADGGVDGDGDDFKDDNLSDEDYFPSNTWASTPKMDPDPSSPPKKGHRSSGGGSLNCKICGKAISSATYMRIHMRTHTGEKPYKCYICNRGFITSSKMHRHVLTHSESWGDGEGQIKAEGMGVKEEKNKDGDDDKEDNAEIIKKAKAKFKKKPKGKNQGDQEKKGRIHQKRPHACEFCQKRFLHVETLQIHKKSHAGEKAELKCYYCLITLEDEDALKTHQETHDGPKPFLCTVCGKSYKKRETMVYHRKNHKPEKEYICDICSKTFNSACKLQRHILSHRTEKFVLRYECPVCAHMFHTKYHVQMHLTTHQKEGLILEENRNAILAMVLQNARKIPKQTGVQAIVPDINLRAADERSRVCNICGEVFQHFYYLEEHLKSHGSRIAIEDEKPEEKKHICQVCNKGFKLHYYLKLHSFTHTKEKPYICQQCGKGFITKGKLKRHLETHAGLKKYQCHICYKFFTRPSYLRIHVRTIHGTQDYNFRGSESMWSGETLKRIASHLDPT